jgi:hypothetical protein
VDQQLAESLPSPRLKRTRFDSTETSEVELRDEAGDFLSQLGSGRYIIITYFSGI